MSGKFITRLWRKKRLRRGFVLSHKDSSSDLAVGGRQLGAGGPSHGPVPSTCMWPQDPTQPVQETRSCPGATPGEQSDHGTAPVMHVGVLVTLCPSLARAVQPRH